MWSQGSLPPAFAAQSPKCRLYATKWWWVCGLLWAPWVHDQGSWWVWDSLWALPVPSPPRVFLWRQSPSVCCLRGQWGWQSWSYLWAQGLGKRCCHPQRQTCLVWGSWHKTYTAIQTQTGKWKRLAAEQSTELGKNSFALLGPLLQYLVVGFLFLGNNQLFIVVCLLCLLFSHYRVFLPVSPPLPWVYRYFCEFFSFSTPRLVWNNNSKYLSSTYYVPVSIQSAAHVLIYLIPIPSEWGGTIPILQMCLWRHREIK